jgi:hypothetical protein
MEALLDVHNVHEVAVLVKAGSFEAEFDDVVMGVQGILCAPVPADQVMLGNKIAFYGYGVHISSKLTFERSNVQTL